MRPFLSRGVGGLDSGDDEACIRWVTPWRKLVWKVVCLLDGLDCARPLRCVRDSLDHENALDILRGEMSMFNLPGLEAAELSTRLDEESQEIGEWYAPCDDDPNTER